MEKWVKSLYKVSVSLTHSVQSNKWAISLYWESWKEYNMALLQGESWSRLEQGIIAK